MNFTCPWCGGHEFGSYFPKVASGQILTEHLLNGGKLFRNQDGSLNSLEDEILKRNCHTPGCGFWWTSNQDAQFMK